MVIATIPFRFLLADLHDACPGPLTAEPTDEYGWRPPAAELPRPCPSCGFPCTALRTSSCCIPRAAAAHRATVRMGFVIPSFGQRRGRWGDCLFRCHRTLCRTRRSDPDSGSAVRAATQTESSHRPGRGPGKPRRRQGRGLDACIAIDRHRISLRAVTEMPSPSRLGPI